MKASSPQFWGGIHLPKSLLLSPYPAIPPYVVRTPHSGMTDDREHISSQYVPPVSSTSFMDPYMSVLQPPGFPYPAERGGRPAPKLKFQKRICIEIDEKLSGPAFRIFGSVSCAQERIPSIRFAQDQMPSTRLLICNGEPQRILRKGGCLFQ